ncbi:MFS transporter [Jatrophihabitans telluris]|uniref:MFS transporter n=1 Tax=Jatrophihabitans telluris TaxID=2038343 RepID=A0ABY4R238_9ACTN|nr:MFS transporter [Jatrophihabitans telluris]UQX89542.1 MFS transporter [Jatrophihabitans telluris]
MRSGLGRTLVLLSGGALATAGWGAVFPFLYADIATARGLGAGVAAGTFTAFAVGSIVAAPAAGWLADRANPTLVAVLSRLALAAFTGLLVLVSSPAMIWAVAAGFGASLALAQPAIQVILLARTPIERRRDVFAWQFIAINLAAAAGAAIGGVLVDLSSQQAMRPVYAVAVLSALISALAVGLAGRGAHSGVLAGQGAAETVSYRSILAKRPVLWLLGVSLLITLACYAQYDAGLPAYILDATTVKPSLLGAAVAMNAILVAVLTGPVVAYTKRRSLTSLLAICALLWVGCWLIFGLPLIIGGFDGAFVMIGFAALSFGETMMAPILSPLAAALAPEGATGRTMAAVSGASTVATAIGPILSSALLGLHLPAVFIVMQVVFCLAAAASSLKLRRIMAVSRSRSEHPARMELELAG